MACKSKNCKTAPRSAKSSKAPRKTIQSTEFVLDAPDASQVFLAGSFNQWNSDEHAMRKIKGKFTKKLKLEPGRYEYQFIVDGQWWTDPANPDRAANDFGSENSVLQIGEEVISFK